jgi:hypothetical protein
MPHLASFRKGWESENLARYLLSRFAFISNPVSVSDDIGIDFFGTIFLHQKIGGRQYLLPKNSFSIQIKSSGKEFDVTDKIEFLNDLELPYFIGIINRETVSMRIYSGEFVPFFFTKVGVPLKLKLNLTDTTNTDMKEVFYERITEGSYKLLFPFIIEIEVTDEPNELIRKVREFSELCDVIHRNISSKNMQEYIFEIFRNPDFVYIFAGSGSEKVFRDNFYKRLAEVFYNLEWIVNNHPETFDLNEFLIYDDVYKKLFNYNKFKLPIYLEGPYISLKETLKEKQIYP